MRTRRCIRVAVHVVFFEHVPQIRWRTTPEVYPITSVASRAQMDVQCNVHMYIYMRDEEHVLYEGCVW